MKTSCKSKISDYKRWEYPCLVVCTTLDTVVLAISDSDLNSLFKGIYLKMDEPSDDLYLGTLNTDFKKDNFRLFDGSITLENG